MPAPEQNRPDKGREQADSEAPSIHRPGEEIANRPKLKVMPPGSRKKEREQPKAPSTASESLLDPADLVDEKAADAVEAERPLRRVTLPSQTVAESRLVGATHAPPPPDERSEVLELDRREGREPEREVSMGFVLGVALIVVALVGGLLLARQQHRIGALERRLSALEGSAPLTPGPAQP